MSAATQGGDADVIGRPIPSGTGLPVAAYSPLIRERLSQVIQSTHLRCGTRLCGKVRDVYDLGDELMLVASDRLSAFDRILASVPFKGAVLTQVSLWWFEQTKHIIANHIISSPHPNVVVAKKCHVLPVEVVVRGFLTGSTSTSVWTHYSNGERVYCGNTLPDGMVKNQRLATAILTPTTKDVEHDRPISPAQVIEGKWMTPAQWDVVSAKALELFAFGQRVAAEHGLILVDTKYEFGVDPASGDVVLVDEIHTPDSSRYWIASTYEERFARGEEPDNIDKEFVRLWFRRNCDPYKDARLPAAPTAMVTELARRYVLLSEAITGETFQFPAAVEAGAAAAPLEASVAEAGYAPAAATLAVLVQSHSRVAEARAASSALCGTAATVLRAGSAAAEVYVVADGEACAQAVGRLARALPAAVPLAIALVGEGGAWKESVAAAAVAAAAGRPVAVLES